MTVQQVKETFLIQDEDRWLSPDDPVTLAYYADHITIYDYGMVTPLVDGEQYFGEIFSQIETLSINPATPDAQGVLLMNWTGVHNYRLPIIAGSPYSNEFLDVALIDLVARGFDVRFLLWVNDYTLSTESNVLNWNGYGAVTQQVPDDAAHATNLHWSVNRMVDNITTVDWMRNSTDASNMTMPLATRVALNSMGHPLGSAHVKMAVIYDATHAIGFTGGFDLVDNRNSGAAHDDVNDWHDVGVKVEGDAAGECYDLFRRIWNEQLTLRMGNPLASPTFLFNGKIVEGMPLGLPPLIERAWTPTATVGNIIQSVRTLPDRGGWPWMSVPGDGGDSDSWPMPVPKSATDISFAPDGLFEIHLALKKLILNADRYIYIEDQAMQSSIILGYIKLRLLVNPTVKVILLTGGYNPDDAPYYQMYSLNRYLFEGLGQAQKDRVKLFKMLPAYVHSKVVIVDDKAAYVGSAGLFNRAMSVSIEHGMVFIDSAENGTRLRDFRVQLWAEHFQIDPLELTQIHDIDQALGVWHPWSGTGGASFKLPQHAPTIFELTYATRFINLASGTQVEVPRSLVAFAKFPGATAESDPAGFLAGTTSTITDNGLPHRNNWDLTGGAIHVLEGPNAGQTPLILAHQDRTITVQNYPQPFDDTTRYLLLQPYIRDFPIGPVSFNFNSRFEYGFTELGFL